MSRYDDLKHQTSFYQKAAQSAPTPESIARQFEKGRMTVWQRMEKLMDENSESLIFFQNWGAQLDGSSIVTAVMKIHGRDVAFYGHDFTLRAGSMDATNGRKLAWLFDHARQQRIPIVGLNDSAGAFVPAGVGGLEGYAQAFAALRQCSGIVPSIMCMFGFNAGGGAYLPRQGSFLIQPKNTFIGLTGVSVVQSVLGEQITADALGGPNIHVKSGVVDYPAEHEDDALLKVRELLRFLPSSCYELPAITHCTDDVNRSTEELDRWLKAAIDSPTGFNTPIDIGILIRSICDYGDYYEFQPVRARNTICAFARIGGYLTGFIANNSAVESGQIDVAAAEKNTRFIRFCNLYNIPLIFIEDTTGFLPGSEQEQLGVIQSGRMMLDAIVDVRTPRILLIVRNAFGGAFATYNNYSTGANVVLALPTARIAVMGAAGREFVYKKEIQTLRKTIAQEAEQQKKLSAFEKQRWIAEEQTRREAQWITQYENEFLNPREALSLGSISEMVQPEHLRKTIAKHLIHLMQHYIAGPMVGPQREF